MPGGISTGNVEPEKWVTTALPGASNPLDASCASARPQPSASEIIVSARKTNFLDVMSNLRNNSFCLRSRDMCRFTASSGKKRPGRRRRRLWRHIWRHLLSKIFHAGAGYLIRYLTWSAAFAASADLRLGAAFTARDFLVCPSAHAGNWHTPSCMVWPGGRCIG